VVLTLEKLNAALKNNGLSAANHLVVTDVGASVDLLLEEFCGYAEAAKVKVVDDMF